MSPRSDELPFVLRALRAVGRLVRVPGFFSLVLEPIHRRLDDYPTLTVVTDVGRMQLDLRDYNQRRIFYYAHEEHESRLVRRLLRPGDAAVDVGANVGYFSLLAASAVAPEGEVHALEPVPENARALERNVQLNGHENVVLTTAAAGRTPGRTSFGIPEGITADLGETSAMYTRAGGGRQVEAEVVVLDSYVAERLPERTLRLIKIDVEGVEPDVLAGLAETLDERPPDALLVELNRDRLADHGFHQEDVVAPLLQRGYRLFRLDLIGRLRPFEPDWARGRALVNVIAFSPRIHAPRDRRRSRPRVSREEAASGGGSGPAP